MCPLHPAISKPEQLLSLQQRFLSNVPSIIASVQGSCSGMLPEVAGDPNESPDRPEYRLLDHLRTFGLWQCMSAPSLPKVLFWAALRDLTSTLEHFITAVYRSRSLSLSKGRHFDLPICEDHYPRFPGVSQPPPAPLVSTSLPTPSQPRPAHRACKIWLMWSWFLSRESFAESVCPLLSNRFSSHCCIFWL